MWHAPARKSLASAMTAGRAPIQHQRFDSARSDRQFAKLENLVALASIQRAKYQAAEECRSDDCSECRWGSQGVPTPVANSVRCEDQGDNGDPGDESDPAITKTAAAV